MISIFQPYRMWGTLVKWWGASQVGSGITVEAKLAHCLSGGFLLMKATLLPIIIIFDQVALSPLYNPLILFLPSSCAQSLLPKSLTPLLNDSRIQYTPLTCPHVTHFLQKSRSAEHSHHIKAFSYTPTRQRNSVTLLTLPFMASTNTSGTSSSSSAPLPSPSASQPSQYFPSHSQNRRRTSTSLPQSQAPTSQSKPQSQQQFQQQPGQAQQYGHDPSQGKSKDFCVVAEAAKRAQVACLMRDMGEVAL